MYDGIIIGVSGGIVLAVLSLIWKVALFLVIRLHYINFLLEIVNTWEKSNPDGMDLDTFNIFKNLILDFMRDSSRYLLFQERTLIEILLGFHNETRTKQSTNLLFALLREELAQAKKHLIKRLFANIKIINFSSPKAE